MSVSRFLQNKVGYRFRFSIWRRLTARSPLMLPSVRGSSLCGSLCIPIALKQAARVVVTWLNRAKEAEERRTRTAAEPLVLDADDGESSEEDDEDQDEFVYDIQVPWVPWVPRDAD